MYFQQKRKLNVDGNGKKLVPWKSKHGNTCLEVDSNDSFRSVRLAMLKHTHGMDGIIIKKKIV